MNSLSLRMGPPALPPNWFRRCGGLLRTPQPLALSLSLRRNSKSEPCTNTVHGSLFEFLRNDKLNANGWGVLSRPPQRRNQFGGSAGGPIRKDKLFIFGSYSGLRSRAQDVLSNAIVPTAAERLGDFSASAKKPVLAGITNGVIAPAS